MEMQRTMQALEHDRRDAEQALLVTQGHAEQADCRARKAAHEAQQWKELADQKSLSELEHSAIEDMLYKPKLDRLTDLYTQLDADNDKLRNAFENLFEDFLDITSKAARKFRPKMTKSQLDANADKLAGKKKNSRKPPPANKKKKNNDKKKKKGKFGPALIKAAAHDRREEFIKIRRKKMSVHVADIVFDCSHANMLELAPDWANKGGDHMVQVLSSPATQHSIVPLPWAKYLKQAPDNIRVAYVDYDRLLDLLTIVYKAAMVQRFGSDITTSEDGIDEVGTFTGRMRLMTDVFREQLVLKLGTKSVVEGYLYGVAEAIVKYAPNNLHIDFFGRIVGVIDPDLYSPRMGALFMRLLRTVASESEAVTLLTGDVPVQVAPADAGEGGGTQKKKKKTKKQKGKNETNEKEGGAVPVPAQVVSPTQLAEDKPLVAIPLARALQAVETVFPTKPEYFLAWSKKELFPPLKEKLIKTLRRLSVASDTSMVLDVNLLLVCAMDVWLEQHETDLYALCKLFRDRRMKEDQPLDYRVFASCARTCKKEVPLIPDSILFPMFEQVLSTKDTAMDVCSRDGFAIVCCAWGVVLDHVPEEVKAGEVDKKNQTSKKSNKK